MGLQIIYEITSFLCSLPFAPFFGALINPLIPNPVYFPFIILICIITAILKPIINNKKVSWKKAYLYAFISYYCTLFLFNLIAFSGICWALESSPF